MDICNGKNGPHSLENATERYIKIVSILDWFSKWKILYDNNVTEGVYTDLIFFADEIWFCTRALFLAYIGAIQIYCVEKNVSINPRCMNTGADECFLKDLSIYWRQYK